MSITDAAPAGTQDRYVLKDNDTFVVFAASGAIENGSDGLFHNDTRLLSHLRLRLDGREPSLLGAGVSRDNVVFTAHLTNQPPPLLGESAAQPGAIHLQRDRFLHDGHLRERLVLVNYGQETVRLPLRLEFGADFRDMFEVRGSVRERRGDLLPAEPDGDRVRFAYRGLDGALRTSVLAFSRSPTVLDAGAAEFELVLEPGVREELFLRCGTPDPEHAGNEHAGNGHAVNEHVANRPAVNGPAMNGNSVDEHAMDARAANALPATPTPSRGTFREAAGAARKTMRRRQRRSGRIQTGSPLFDAWLDKSRADLALLTSDLTTGPYPYAGIPWFSTPFGRDAVITALQTLWLDPGIARGVLAFLAAHQAREESAFLDAAPGKIMHETRKGEMSALRELPFGLYYGGVDTTPLFVMLAGAYAQRTGEQDFIEQLWPALLAAAEWIRRVCAANPYGLLDYQRGEETGLSNQGWKDSQDSVFHADGRFPPGPIALVEVQGYAYAALRAMASMAAQIGRDTEVDWLGEAQRLRESVEARFWMAGGYGIAVDGDGALCRIRASNQGHLLYSGLASPERAQRVCADLLSPAFYSGWGLRTLAQGEPRFNPMSYHNGSVWPHDTALCAAGMARYGQRAGAQLLLHGLFEAALHFDMRLPELFCGFPRARGSRPVPYPVACLPQAWAAGSAFMLLQACLGIEIDGRLGEVQIERPMLPVGVERLTVHRVAVAGEHVNILFQRDGDRVSAHLQGDGATRVPLRMMG
jgi:glycogen debranching enzyme